MNATSLPFRQKHLVRVEVTSWFIPAATLYIREGKKTTMLKDVVLDEKFTNMLVLRRDLFPRVLWTTFLWHEETRCIIDQKNLVNEEGGAERIREYFMLCPYPIFIDATTELEATLTREVYQRFDLRAERREKLDTMPPEQAFALCMRGNRCYQIQPHYWRFIIANSTRIEHMQRVLGDCPYNYLMQEGFVRCATLFSEEEIKKHITEKMVTRYIRCISPIFVRNSRLQVFISAFPRAFIDNIGEFTSMNIKVAKTCLLPHVTDADIARDCLSFTRLFGNDEDYVRLYWRQILNVNEDLIGHVGSHLRTSVILPAITCEDVRKNPVKLAHVFGKNPLFSKTYVKEIYAFAPSALTDLTDEAVETLGITADALLVLGDHISALTTITCIDKIAREAIKMRHSVATKLPERYNGAILDSYGYEGIAQSGPEMVIKFVVDPEFVTHHAISAVLNDINNMRCFHGQNAYVIDILEKQFAMIPLEVAFAAHMNNAMFYRNYIAARPHVRNRVLLAGVDASIIGFDEKLKKLEPSIRNLANYARTNWLCPWRGQLHKVHWAVDHCRRDGWLRVIPRDMFVLIMQYVWNCEMV